MGLENEVNTGAPVDTLLKRVIGPLVKKAPDPKREPLVAVVDEALSDTMRAVLHQPEFQNLESLWRGMDLLLRRVVRTVAQVREHVGDVCKLLFEVALEGLQPLDQLWTARERAAKEHPRATAPAMGMTVVHVHLLSS